MGSNVNSDGEAVDHDGMSHEDGVFKACAPFAISRGIFQELFSGSGKDNAGSHLEGDPLDGAKTKPSCSSGILVATDVIVEDYYSSDEPSSPRSASELCKNETSATVHAMLRSTKHEREELFTTRRKLADALQFLRSQGGFTEEHILAAQHKDGFGSRVPSRDDFGLPLPQSTSGKGFPNPFVDKMKGNADSIGANSDGGVRETVAGQVFDELTNMEKSNKDDPKSNSTPTGTATKPTEEARPKSSAEMMGSSPNNNVLFDYFPMKSGSGVVSPPLEVLKKGNDRQRYSIVGTFLKGRLPFKKVADFAMNMWKKFGLQHVSQKDEKTFVFRSQIMRV